MKNEMDYICGSIRWKSALKDVRTFRGVDIGSNHHLVIGAVKLKLKRLYREKNPAWSYVVEKLNDQ